MKKLLLSAAVVTMAALAITAKSTKEPIVMTVAGNDVTLSEFEYLYNKNSNQQLTPLTFDEYVEMFINYKLKVAEALNEKLDTTPSFKAEFQKFRRDLAQPYLKDTVLAEELVRKVYDHTAEDVYVSHIMIHSQDPRKIASVDSLRTRILNGEITFEDAARQYSADRNSSVRGGRMGWVTGMGPYPWPFEEACYDTPVGQLSPVINSGVGYHIIRPEERRKSPGEVEAQHILLLTRGLDADEEAAVKARIDSIYDVVTQPGADFGAIATKYSQDPGSARQGGYLGWFGSGKMVAEFDSTAFALANGEISKPFKTSYGYHIIHRINHRGQRSLEELRPEIENEIAGDERAQMPIKSNIAKAAAQTGSKIYDYSDEIYALMAKNGNECDTTLISMVKASTVPAYIALGKTATLSEALSKAVIRPGGTPEAFIQSVNRAVENAFNNVIIEYEIQQLEINEPSYRNLVNEYRDGILLFDVSNQNVWERATKDTEGLKKQFAENKEKYSTWTAPKFKSYVIFTTGDSILNEVQNYANLHYGGQRIADIDQEAFTADLKNKFGKDVKVERVIAAKGDNAITDYLGFGAEKPAAKGQNWITYFAFAKEIIDQPEEVSDVKGLVISDYQTKLEQEWINSLRNKYKVKINKKELQKANK